MVPDSKPSPGHKEVLLSLLHNNSARILRSQDPGNPHTKVHRKRADRHSSPTHTVYTRNPNECSHDFPRSKLPSYGSASKTGSLHPPALSLAAVCETNLLRSEEDRFFLPRSVRLHPQSYSRFLFLAFLYMPLRPKDRRRDGRLPGVRTSSGSPFSSGSLIIKQFTSSSLVA